MDIIKTLITLLTIGIAVYSFVSDARKKRRDAAPPPSPSQREAGMKFMSAPASAASPPRPLSQSPKVSHPELPEEGGRVTSDEDEGFMEETDDESPETEDLRNAIIWSEILQRKF